MKTELSVVNAAIDVPGVAFTRNAVMFTKEVKLENLNRLMGWVTEIQGGTAWWYGDIGIKLQEQAIAEKKGDDYTSGRAEILGIDEGYWRNCVSVARFYPVSHRCDSSWAHHREAMRGAGGSVGDVKKASLWLSQSKEMGWSVSDLRRQVNLSLATSKPPETAPEGNPFEAIDEVDAWLTKKPNLPEITPDQARAQLVRWQALIAFLKQLETLASKS